MKDRFRSILKFPVLEKMWVRLVKNKTYGTTITKLTPNHYSYNDPSIRKVTRNGINYELNIANIVEWHLYFGFRETAKEKLFRLNSNPVSIIDVGANIGEVSLGLAYRYPNASVYGFEPHPVTFQKLKNNHSLNQMKNVQLLNLGLGSKKSEVHFEERAIGNPGMNRVTADPGKSAHQIQITTLDSFIAENQVPEVSVIKIDVEGYEHEVLKGAVDLLTHTKPVLFIELDDSNLMEQGSNATDFIQFIYSFGYVIEHAETGEIITKNSPLKSSHFDIICKPSN
ncbi:Methyltransferase domain protein [compost metagenome]